jgi:heptosyltransferase-2
LKILVTALSGIGDALMFTPALKVLKEHLPESKIDALVMYKGVEDIYSRLPEIEEIHYHDFLKKNPFTALSFLLKLRKKYDATINIYPSNRREYNLISYLTGSEKRLGVRYLRRHNRNLGFLNNLTFQENDSLHNVAENVNLVSLLFEKTVFEIPPLNFPLAESDKEYARRYIDNLGIETGRMLVGLHPGCSTLKNHIKRRWEPEKFAQLAERIIADHNSHVLIFGGPEEEDLKEGILKKIDSGHASSVSTSSLAETAAIMARCSLFVSNDSSLMHVAAALRLKTVSILGPTNKNYIHPWMTEYKIASIDLDCSPCFYYSPRPLTCTRSDVKFKCIKELGVELVYRKAEEFIRTSS